MLELDLRLTDPSGSMRHQQTAEERAALLKLLLVADAYMEDAE